MIFMLICCKKKKKKEKENEKENLFISPALKQSPR